MSKICIVSISAPRNMIMVYMYTTYLCKHNIDFDMIYLDRYHEDENTGAKNTYRIEYNRGTKAQIVKGYLDFKARAEMLLNKNNYKFVIVWSELTAAVLVGVLSKKYSGRYCVNIRDLFVGKRKLLNFFLFKAIYKSGFTTVSSIKYLNELPKNYDNYLVVHSINEKIINETRSACSSKKNNKAIEILYIGNIRFLDHLFRFIDEVKNDRRYHLIVAGAGSEPVAKYASQNEIHNILTIGTFPKEETGELLARADVLYNLYGTEDINLRYALSNKLYYAICLSIPILVYKDTYMYEFSKKCGIGFAVDEHNNRPFADKFYEWFTLLNREEIEEKCYTAIEEAKYSQKVLIDNLLSYI